MGTGWYNTRLLSRESQTSLLSMSQPSPDGYKSYISKKKTNSTYQTIHHMPRSHKQRNSTSSARSSKELTFKKVLYFPITPNKAIFSQFSWLWEVFPKGTLFSFVTTRVWFTTSTIFICGRRYSIGLYKKVVIRGQFSAIGEVVEADGNFSIWSSELPRSLLNISQM